MRRIKDIPLLRVNSNMLLKVSEEHDVVVVECPFGDQMKPRLMEACVKEEKTLSYKTNVQAQMTSYETKSEHLTTMEEWIYQLIGGGAYTTSGNRFTYEFTNSWFAVYNNGDYTKSHMHFPAILSWVYMINCPEGSSPLVFDTSGDYVEAKDNTMIIFPASMRHSVPQNKCSNRVVAAGNICWNPNLEGESK